MTTAPMYMKLDMLPLNPETIALYNDHKQQAGDAGLDLFMPNDVTLSPNSLGNRIGLGIKCRAHMLHRTKPMKHWPTGYIVYLRSSTGLRTPFRLSNHAGIIDENYRGELCLLLDNHSDCQATIKAGTRLAQICAPNLGRIQLEIVSELDDTARGEGGLGSSGQ